jgi:hypothetical protein
MALTVQMVMLWDVTPLTRVVKLPVFRKSMLYASSGMYLYPHQRQCYLTRHNSIMFILECVVFGPIITNYYVLV